MGGEGDSAGAGLFFPAIVATGTDLSPENKNVTFMEMFKRKHKPFDKNNKKSSRTTNWEVLGFSMYIL